MSIQQSSARRLPASPSIEHLRNQAKQLVKSHRAGRVDAFARIQASYPRLAEASVHDILKADFSLGHAQIVIAHEYGFDDWKALADAVAGSGSPVFADTLVDAHPGLRRIEARIGQAAATDLPVLITGERGTGKALAGHAVHTRSARESGPFVRVRCDSAGELLVESALFGHEEGAFTGARSRLSGKVEAARRGTLFLDEVHCLSTSAQARLVRLIEEGTFERLGGGEEIEADVRIIAATSQDLPRAVSERAFREDLAFELRKMELRLPPLRDMKEELPALARHFVAEMAAHLGRKPPELSTEAEAALTQHDWPGNVRELEQRAQRAAADCAGAVIVPEHLGV